MTADVPSRIAFATSLASARVGSACSIIDLEHLRGGDHRLADLQAAQDDALLEQRHRGGADLDAEVAAGDHHPVRLDQDLLERGDRLRLLDLRDHAGRRAVLADDRLQLPTSRRAHGTTGPRSRRPCRART